MKFDTRDPRMALGVVATAFVLAVALGRITVFPVWPAVADTNDETGGGTQMILPTIESGGDSEWADPEGERPGASIRQRGVDPTTGGTASEAERPQTERPLALKVPSVATGDVSSAPDTSDTAERPIQLNTDIQAPPDAKPDRAAKPDAKPAAKPDRVAKPDAKPAAKPDAKPDRVAKPETQ
jgi:hypothetical protein